MKQERMMLIVEGKKLTSPGLATTVVAGSPATAGAAAK